MISAFLFDLDGTLFDSSKANIKSYDQAFNEAKVPFNQDRYASLFGLRFNEMINEIAPTATKEQRQLIKESKSRYYKENLSLVRPNLGLLVVVQSIRPTFKSALVTTASKANVQGLLDYFSIPTSSFDVIIAGEDVEHGKPDPECYLLAMQRLGVKAAECCVFEDTDIGIEAARNAGAHFIRVSI